MKTPISKYVLFLFLLGISLGFTLGILFPTVSESYFEAYVKDINFYAIKSMEAFGFFGNTIAIFSRNAIFASILILGPYIIANTYLKQEKDGKSSLILFTTCSIFIYGFFPYGLFMGHLWSKLPLELFQRWMLYFLPHGFLETAIILWAGSTAMQIKDNILLGINHNSIKFTQFKQKIIVTFALLLFSEFLEIMVSPYFLNK